MIRLGTLGGYAFSGPRLLGGWSPPARPGVYAILYKPDLEAQRYAVICVGHADDLAAEGFPFRHRRAACWTKRAGSKWKVHVAVLEVPGGTRGHREMITDELVSRLPSVLQRAALRQSWREEWIGGLLRRPHHRPAARPVSTAQPGASTGSVRRARQFCIEFAPNR